MKSFLLVKDSVSGFWEKEPGFFVLCSDYPRINQVGRKSSKSSLGTFPSLEFILFQPLNYRLTRLQMSETTFWGRSRGSFILSSGPRDPSLL